MRSFLPFGIGILAATVSAQFQNNTQSTLPTATTLNGTYYGSLGSMCYGYGATRMVLGQFISEDCLTLNVYRPSNVSSSKGLLPVAVYIHGGLFKHGTGRDPRYNMTSLLQVGVQNRQEFIGVTLNYRMCGMWISFFHILDPNNHPVNGTNVWPKYNANSPEKFVFDVNATELSRSETDDFRSEAISYWIDLFSTNEHPK
ncbi:carboxylesterase [Colletotrichum gloeosporioides Cg-14]|uniref:Carboxylesterase n=1 Tax=Colletotrichum gloeosporioides (strain Cg-14) TaxID=1237896 RepID=T0KNJ9_COLGC|nr:carboxylesterase [Colletotrichum gloeosporioides Cg-14]